jgi:hypothetical protein
MNAPSPFFNVAVMLIASGSLLFVAHRDAHGAVNYSAAGSAYVQDFNSLPISPENTSLGGTPAGWIDDTTTPGANQYSILGWYLYHPTSVTEGGASGNQRFRISSAPGNTGSFYSFGASGSTERALGAIGANTLAPDNSGMYIGLRLHNDTGQTLEHFTLSYYGEQWRNGGGTEGLSFGWSTTATAINDGSFNTVAALAFNAPVNGGTASALNGNDNRIFIGPVMVTGMEWLPGTDLWLRWVDVQIPGADHGLAIDDVSFLAVIPEPSAITLIVAGGAALLMLRRRK